MNFILLLPPPIKYNSTQQQLSEFDSHVSKLPLRRSLQFEGVANSIDIFHAQSMASAAIAKPSGTFCFYEITAI